MELTLRFKSDHPMDEFMHPQRAAQRRAHYEDVPDSDETVPPSDPEDNGSESEDVYRRDAKRIRLSDHSSVRRSLRGTNQNVNYRMDVHPQDQELASMEDEVVLASTETASIEESGAVGAILESARDQAQYLVEQIELVDSEDEVESVLHQEQGTNGKRPSPRTHHTLALAALTMISITDICIERTMHSLIVYSCLP